MSRKQTTAPLQFLSIGPLLCYFRLCCEEIKLCYENMCVIILWYVSLYRQIIMIN